MQSSRAYSVAVTRLGGGDSGIEEHVHADVRVTLPPAAEIDGQGALGLTTWQLKALQSREDLELEIVRCALALAARNRIT
jgi:hypothetical protein